MRATIALVILFPAAPSAWAGSVWDAQFSRGEAFEKAGRYQDAAVEFEGALREAEHENPNNVQVPVTWNNLGVVYRALGRTREAERYYRLAIVYYENHAGLEPALATSIENLAALNLTIGRLSKAEPLYRRSYEIRLRVMAPDDPNIAESLHGLAQLEHARHRYRQAEDHYRQALAIQQKAFGPMSLKSAPALHNFAALLSETGRIAEARGAYVQVLSVYRSAAPGHPAEAVVLRHLAELDAAAGLASQADAEFQSALAICESTLPPSHPQTGAILQAYGMFLRRNGQAREAVAVLTRANSLLSASAKEDGSAYVVDASAIRRIRVPE